MKLPVVVIPGEQGAVAAGTLLTGGAVTVTFGTADADDNPATGSDRGVLLHRPGVRRLGQARPRRARRRASRARRRAAATWPQTGTSVAAAQVAGRRGARAAGASRLVARGPCAARSSARRARCATARATAPRPSRRRAEAPSTWPPRAAATVVAEPVVAVVRARARAARRASSACSRSRTRARRPCTCRSSLSARRRRRRLQRLARRRAVEAGDRAGRDACPVPLTLKAHDLPDATTVIGGWLLVADRRRRHAARALGARPQRRPRRGPDRRRVARSRRCVEPSDERRARREAHARARLGALGRRGAARDLARAAPERRPLPRLAADRPHHRAPRAPARQLPLRHHGHRPEHAASRSRPASTGS